MSGLGHLAPAFAAKSVTPKTPLWILLIASETNDLLSQLFSAFGIEPRVVITEMDFVQGIRYLAPVISPWSHGLFMSLIWAILAAAIVYLIYRDQRTSVVIGSVVISHWLLDLLMHSNLPLFFDGSPQVGLGLENSGSGFLLMTVLDLLLLALGLVIYFRARKGTLSNEEVANV
jgi:hypothetical protein